MERNIGIWIDSRAAHFVVVNEDDHTTFTIESDIDKRERIEGESNDVSRFGNQSHNHEKKRDKKIAQEMKEYMDAILEKITPDDKVVVFGPANTKLELKKAIESDHKLNNVLLDVVASDSLTDNQTIAWVKDYFAKHV